jgi:hypothetical protein
MPARWLMKGEQGVVVARIRFPISTLLAVVRANGS